MNRHHWTTHAALSTDVYKCARCGMTRHRKRCWFQTCQRADHGKRWEYRGPGAPPQGKQRAWRRVAGPCLLPSEATP